jgi:hypothetical protein
MRDDKELFIPIEGASIFPRVGKKPVNTYIVYTLDPTHIVIIKADKVYEEGEGSKRVVFTLAGEIVAAFPYVSITGWVKEE